MAIMQKGNKQVRVTEEKIEEFLKMGYSEVDKEGEILQVGQATDLKDIKAENDTLKAELAKYKSNGSEEFEVIKASHEALIIEAANKDMVIDVLRKEKEALATELEALKVENETLKADKKAK